MHDAAHASLSQRSVMSISAMLTQFFTRYAAQKACLVLLQLSEKMMGQAQGQELEQLQALHRRLLGQLTQVLSSPHTSSRETAVAVAGIGHLAPPTRRFFGQQVASHKLSPVAFMCSLTAVGLWALHTLLITSLAFCL